MKTPYFTLSKKIILEQYKKASSISDVVSYSSKTNPLVTPILEQETNCLFSVHLFNELKNIQDMSRVLFLAQAWSKEDIRNYLDKGISRFVVDNESDVNVLREFLKENPETHIVQLFFRVKLKENTLRTEKYFVFGMTSEIVTNLIAEFVQYKQIQELGIHFHRKTQNMAEWNLQYELEHMFSKDIFDTISCINIGGGLPSVYANTNDKVIDSIMQQIISFKDFLYTKDVKLMVEPGRFIAAPAGKLHTTILSINENTLVVNASVYNTDMDALIVPVKLLIENEVDKTKGTPYIIKGITPCSLDLFRYKVYLKKPVKGAPLIFLNAGAYNFTTNFVDLNIVPTKVIEK